MGWVFALIVLAAIAAVFLRIDDWNRDWTTNSAETNAQSAAADLRPLHSPLPPESLEQQVRDWVSRQVRWQFADESARTVQVAPQTDSSAHSPIQLHLVRTTAIMRFKDDVLVTIDADPDTGGSVLHVKSRSRVGRGDLGQNPRNIKELIAAMKARP